MTATTNTTNSTTTSTKCPIGTEFPPNNNDHNSYLLNFKVQMNYWFSRCEACCTYSLQGATKNISILDMIVAVTIMIVELVFVALPDTYIALYNLYNMKGEVMIANASHKTWLFVTVLIVSLFLLSLEGWLCDILWRGASQKDRKKLNRWFNFRVLLFVIDTLVTIYRIVDYIFCFYDLIYLPLKMYRILEIIVVKALISEIDDDSEPV